MYNHRGEPTGTNHKPSPQRRLMGATATYLGAVGNSHLFSAEATGGGKTDSYQVNLNPKNRTSDLRRGAVYHVDMTPGSDGFHPMPIQAHEDQKPGVAQWSE